MATIHYHDIFDYPLTGKEILNYLISKRTTEKVIISQLKKMVQSRKLQEQGGYYFLNNKNQIVNLRKKRIKHSASKLKKAKIYSGLLKMIPAIQFVGISGALSMENSTKFDDIDFVIICRRNSLWTTRFLTNVLLFPVKRNPGSKKTNNRACLNLFLDESDLRIYNENIYQAHEICQLKPIWQRNNAYLRFIKANKWIYTYLPNWHTQPINNLKSRGVPDFSLITYHFSPIEIFLKKFQLFYMRKKISTEIVGDTQLFFHPAGTQERVLKEYQKRLKSLQIYDKVI